MLFRDASAGEATISRIAVLNDFGRAHGQLGQDTRIDDACAHRPLNAITTYSRLTHAEDIDTYGRRRPLASRRH